MNVLAHKLDTLFPSHASKANFSACMIDHLAVAVFQKLKIVVYIGIVPAVYIVVCVEGSRLRGGLIAVVANHLFMLSARIPSDVII